MNKTKAHLYLIIALIFNIHVLPAQEESFFVLEDAKKLSALLDSKSSKLFKGDDVGGNMNEVFLILSKYFPAEGKIEEGSTLNADDYQKLMNKIAANPFLKRYKGSLENTANSSVTNTPIGSNDIKNTSSPTLDPISPIPLNTLVDGLGKFLAQRFKEELSVAFFAKFRKDLESQEDLRTLFPKTYDKLLFIDKYIYENQLALLKEDFISDLENIWKQLGKVIENKLPKEKKIDAPYFAFKTTFMVIRLLEGKTHPAELLSELTDIHKTQNINIDVRNSLILTGILSEAFRSSADDDIWLQKEALETIKTDKDVQFFFLGLLYQRVKILDPQFSFGGISLLDNISGFDPNVFYDNLDSLNSAFKEVIDKVESFVEKGKRSLKKIDSGDKTDFVVAFFDQISLLGEVANSNANLLFKVMKQINKQNIKLETATKEWLGKADTYLKGLEIGVELYKNIKNAHPDTTKNKLFHYVQAFTKIAELYQHMDFIFQQENSLNKLDKNTKKVADRVIFYGIFIGKVLTAQSGEEVSAILNAYLLPAGSYRIKRTRKFNFAVNAYVGGFTSWNWKDMDQPMGMEAQEDRAFTYGLNAPVGLSISTKLGKSNNPSSSLSLFLPIIDIGAVTAFRLNPNNDTLKVPDISFRNIVSPGAFLIWGIGDSPFSLGGGVQYNQGLLKLDDNVFTPSDFRGWSTRFFLSVDIPLLNIANSSR